MVTYQTSLEGISAEHLRGFFVGWPAPPKSETHLRVLQNSDYVVLAVDEGKVIGFINAITDKTLAAYIPLLEVLPEYQNKGIGTELAKEMLVLLKDFYMVDLLCDAGLQPFYENLGMEKAVGMRIRNFDKQSGNSSHIPQ